MMKRVVLSALVGTLLVVSTGCSPECTDQYDCTNNKGAPPAGQEWTCTANKCVATNIGTPGTDAGTDAGTGGTTDAGTGTGGTDAGTDAGTVPDMSIAEGAACTTTASCMAGLYCDATQKCAPLQLVFTVTDSATSGSQNAVISPYKPATGSTGPTMLSETSGSKSRFPRWSTDGKTVAFVEDDSSGLSLVTRALPLAAGNTSTLVTGTAAGTTDFRYMEWEPGPAVLWVTKTASSTSGIAGIAPGGTLTNYETAGVFPSWYKDGTSFVYSANSLGLKVRSVSTGSDGTVPGVTSTSAEQPLYNKVNGVVLYLDAKGNTESFGGSTTPLTELYTPVVAPATDATVIAAATTGTGDPAINSYIFNHTWSPLGTHVAYVRVYYSKSSSGTATLCNDGTACGGQVGNVVFVRRVNPDGTPSGEEMQLATEATLPSFSPDGQFIAYLSGGKLFVQQIDPAATTAATLKKGSAIQHTWSSTTTRVESSFGDDDRPRWQPR